MASVPTIQIKVPPTKGNEAGVLTINAADFDPAKHVCVDEEAPAMGERGVEHESKVVSKKTKKDQG
jgi:hypothetical protein